MGCDTSRAAVSAIDSDAMRSIPLPSSKRLEIGGYCVQILLVQIHRRHQRAWFDGVGIVNPQSKVFGSIWAAPDAMVSRLIK